MDTFPAGTQTPFARAISAEVRAQLAARNITYKDLVNHAGISSTNYISIRLRDLKPLDLDDVQKIVTFLDGDSHGIEEFIEQATSRHWERIEDELSYASDRPELAIAALDDEGIAGEKESHHYT